jgi:hypothetical protein
VRLWDAGWGWCKKIPYFCALGYEKSHNRIAYKIPQSKVLYYLRAHSCPSLTEQPTPLAATAAAAAEALLGMRRSAWLTFLAKLASLGSRQHHGQAADGSAFAARLQPRAKMGGGGAVLALLGLCWGRAADALACAARLRPSAKMGGGSVALASLGRFAWLASGSSR